MRGRLAMAMMAGSAIGLGGCTTTGGGTSVRRDLTPVPVRALTAPGLDRVMGRDATALVQLFGKPDADVTEGQGRKLQFTGAACVLDAYLYPRGAGLPVVTYVDSRQPDGAPIDRASCIAALTRREGGK